MTVLRFAALLLLAWPPDSPAQSVPPVEVAGRLLSASFRAHAAVVYLVPLDPPAPDPDRGGAALIDQTGLRFVPRVLPVAVGATVEFRNSDSILHNVFSPGLAGVDTFDLGLYPQGQSRSHTFTGPGAHVILCHVHPDMVAYVVVVPTPLHGVTGPDGAFRIGGVPPGRYRLHVWHQRAAPLARDITVRPDQAALPAIEITLQRR